MKKLIMLIVFTIITNTIIAQKCKAHISNVDRITEQTTDLWGGKLDSKSEMITGIGYNIKLLIAKDTKNEIYALFTLTSKVHESKIDRFAINFTEGGEYIIKTDSGIIKLPIQKIFKSNSKLLNTFSIVNQLFGYITKEGLEKLANENILMYRVVTSNGETIEGKVSKKTSKKLKHQFNCLRNDLKN